MADLENLLLEAAGRTGPSGRSNRSRQSRRRREGSYSDDEFGREDNTKNKGFKGRRKSSGSQVPLKKRLDPGEKGSRLDNEEDRDDAEDRQSPDENDSDSAPSVGSDLYKDDEDRENLANMTELDREMILAERSIKRDDYQLKKKARATSSKTDKKSRNRTPPLPRTGRSSAKSAAKDDALNEILAKRLKQQDTEGFGRRHRDTAEATESNQDSYPPKRKILHPASPSPSSSSSESQDLPRRESLPVSAPKQLQESDDDEQSNSNSGSDSEPLDFDDVKQITIRRSKLAKLFMEPFFEDLIVGCFVRVGIGRTRSGTSLYRLCLVLNVDASDPDRLYKFENRSTYKYLNCSWGAESNSARWQMAMISDSPPVYEEFKALLKETSRAGGKLPTREEVMSKKEAIQKIGSFVYSAETVRQMLMEKKSAAVRPTNVAAEKDRLRKEMEVAEARGDEAEMVRIRDRLKKLEEMGKTKDSKAARLAEMNKRNREENFRNLSERRPDNSRVGEAGYDPFSRRWTRSRNYYAADTTAAEEAAAAQQEAAAEEGKLVDTAAPTDKGKEASQLHDFELPISLAALQRFGGAMGAQVGYMARRQRIEATVGVRLPENDGRRHPLTLTVSDYKRRRGLL